MTPAELRDFRDLIDGDRRDEAACTAFLSLALEKALPAVKQLLLPAALMDHAAIDSAVLLQVANREEKLRAGRLDLSIVFDANTGDGRRAKRCVVWEMKAPQLAAFDRVTDSRWGATADLNSAEEQLLHYVAELKDGGVPLGDGTVIKGAQVSAGGIIIGRLSHLPAVGSADAGRYFLAKQIREECIYKHNSILLRNWDYIYEALAAKNP